VICLDLPCRGPRARSLVASASGISRANRLPVRARPVACASAPAPSSAGLCATTRKRTITGRHDCRRLSRDLLPRGSRAREQIELALDPNVRRSLRADRRRPTLAGRARRCQLPGHEWPGLQLLFVTGCHASRRAGDL
jgi:hypothetical protein